MWQFSSIQLSLGVYDALLVRLTCFLPSIVTLGHMWAIKLNLLIPAGPTFWGHNFKNCGKGDLAL